MPRSFDLAIVGAGIVGLAHALAAARRGKRVVLFDRDTQANGASIRNFGFVTVTGQQAGETWERARRSRDIWADIAPKAGIDILQLGLAVAARRPEAVEVLEAFLATDMGRECRLTSPDEALALCPSLRSDAVKAVMWSPHELRVESATAVPRLAAYLAEALGVEIHRGVSVSSVEPPLIQTGAGRFEAEAAIVCPGDDLVSLFADRIAAYGLSRCLLHMMRVDTAPRVNLGSAVMSDLGLVRYRGYADLPQAAALRETLQEEQPDALEHGVHLIAVQSADGSLVVGDSHLYADTPPPFAPSAVDRLITDEMQSVLRLPGWSVRERWTGTYASASDRLMLVDAPSEAVRLVIVTSGTGASTAFAIGEDVVADLFG